MRQTERRAYARAAVLHVLKRELVGERDGRGSFHASCPWPEAPLGVAWYPSLYYNITHIIYGTLPAELSGCAGQLSVEINTTCPTRRE